MLSSEEGRSPCTQSIILMVLDAPSHRGKNPMPSLSHRKNTPMFTLQKSRVRLTHGVTEVIILPGPRFLPLSLRTQEPSVLAPSMLVPRYPHQSCASYRDRQTSREGRRALLLKNLSEERCFLEASKFPSHWVTWIFPLLRRWDKP